MGGQKLDLAKLYHEVIKRNGHKEVTITKQWKQVADAFQLPKSLTSASFLMRSHYERYLYEFEARYRTRHCPALRHHAAVYDASLPTTAASSTATGALPWWLPY